MGVAEILAHKGREVVTIHPSQSIEAAAQLLADNKIGAVVAIDRGNKVCGIVSERDLVRVIAKQGASALQTSIDNCMTKDVIGCTDGEDINSLMDKMTTGRFRHLPVINDGKLAGIISIGDVVKRKIQLAELEAEEMKRYIA